VSGTETATVAIESAIRSIDDIVLVSMPLKEGTDRANLSRFGEDIWDLGPAIFQVTARNAYNTIEFQTIICGYERLIAKEYIYARLNELLPDRAGPLRPLSARQELALLRRFMAFVRGKLGRFDIGAVDQDMLDAYLAKLKTRKVQARQVATCLRPIAQLRRLAPFLTRGGLPFVPWNGRPIFAVAGCRGLTGENVTPRIPESVVGALVRWSLKYIDLFAPDIFAARAELDALERTYQRRAVHRKGESVLTGFKLWVAGRRDAGRGVPVWITPKRSGGLSNSVARSGRYGGFVVNVQLISLQTGIHITVLSERRIYELMLTAIDELGIEAGGMDTPISIDPDTGRPWRERFDGRDLVREERHLQTAAYVLCAYLTGMRDGEVQAMLPGCLSRELRSNGTVERLAIRSTIYKGRAARGEIEEWITIPPVARAVQVAERLASRHRASHHHDGLWIVLNRSSAVERGISHIVRQINRYREHLDDRYGIDGVEAIPLVDGERWVFNTRQFRRTLAWYIANRPFGVVAGKIQYKHASVAMFDGYAGASTSGFRQEIEQERVLGQMDDIVAQYQACRRGERLAGPAGTRIIAEMQRVEEAGALPGVIADEKRVKAMLAHLARTLHVGILNDCFFDPATALCLRSPDKDRSLPKLSSCAPDRCPNSCITHRHVPAWQAAIDDADRHLKNKHLSSMQRMAIRRDRNRMGELIAPLLEPEL
jgi:hypothetical protein